MSSPLRVSGSAALKSSDDKTDSSSNMMGAVLPDAPPSRPSLRADRGKLVGIGAMGALVAVGVGLLIASPKKGLNPPPLSLTSAELLNADAGPSKEAANTNAVADAGATGVVAPILQRPAFSGTPVWRVSALKEDSNIEVVEGNFAKGGLVSTLSQAGLARNEIKRIAQAFDDVRRITRPIATDTFVIAKDKAKQTIVAFEFATSPLDVWQAKFESAADATAIAKKLDLYVEHRRVASSLVISADLAKAITAANMRPEIVDAVDDALEGHIDPGSLRAGVRMRVVATEDWVDGTFTRVKVEAIEFVPRQGNPLRVYFYERGNDVEGSARRAPAPGFYDAKGKQPYRGQFRTPLPLARVTSRFNPKRMHPVLKVVMPHNGVDYGATTGTPVYASAAGTVTTAGNGGPCGNMVEIDHGGGITTAYCHLKGFAGGLRAGQKVEARQHIGYVGQTGRVTGPHLHFVVKKNGQYIDPLGLKMDGVRVLPVADRDSFAKKRSDLDVVIDGVALPSAADVPDDKDTDEDKDLHEQ